MTKRNAGSAREIAQDLRTRIAAGEFAPGRPLTPRPELAEHYGVARATLDRAIEQLVRAGVLDSRQGAGTWVRAEAPLPRVVVIGTPLPLHHLPGGLARLSACGYDQVATATQRRELLAEVDGVLWNRPEEPALAWATELQGRVPQVLVNRAEPGFTCVSTDHRTPYFQLTGERLDRLPQARPFFLRKAEQPSLVSRYREEGFTAACRERQRFHEQIAMPDAFAAKLALLERTLDGVAGPLLLVADSMQHTGAVMAWVRARGLRWQDEVWYSDFDNALGPDIWGVEVTSFLQSDAAVHAAALSQLVARIVQPGLPAAHVFVAPEHRMGQT